MAYVEPTAAVFKDRFRAFADVDNTAINYALAEAGRRVDTRWTEGDYTQAKMLYAAHILAMDGFGSSREVQLLGFKRIKVGPLELERSTEQASRAGTLASTSYGVRFAELARLNFPGGLASG